MEFTKAKKGLKRLLFIRKRELVSLGISFLLGRTFIMDTISPFAISYLCTHIYSERRSAFRLTLTAIASLAGILTTHHSNTAIRYLLAYVLLGLIYISASTIWEKHIKHIPIISSVMAIGISGTIYYGQQGNLSFNFIMLFFECVLCAVFPLIIKKAPDVICHKDIFADTTSEDVVAISLITTVAMGGFCDIYIGDVSLGKTLCGVFIMIFAYTGKCALSVTCGVGLGIIFSLYSFEYNEYAGILGFCGLITGIASGFKRPGIILAFLISTRLLTSYFGGWSDSVFSMFETVIAIGIFCLIPQSLLMRIKAYFSVSIIQNSEFRKYRDMLNSKIKTATSAFTTLAELSNRVFGNLPENTNDLSTIYDITATRVCRSCGLKFVCWDKEAFDTRDALNKAMLTISRTGELTADTTPSQFKRKCVRYEKFINELNRTYLKYKSGSQTHRMTEQSRKMLTTHLKGVSDLMSDFSEDLTKCISFDKLDESKIMYNMEQSDIKCYDITVVKDYINIASVTVVVKQGKEEFTKLCEKTEEIVSDSLNRIMKIESYSCLRNKFTLKLKETERFSVSCSFVSIPVEGETICGDSIIHGKISGSRYVMILSDGMGCGKKAYSQSATAIELMQQFLNAGFNKASSVEMINSALMLRSSETFATLDTVIVDMFTAKTEFIKAGANTTYIKSGNFIKKFSSTSLPLGIISDTKAETIEYDAKDGDIIIIISDGVHNATDTWFEDYILNMHEESPAMIARLLTDEAKRRSKQTDDMTTAVLKITKKKEGIYV